MCRYYVIYVKNGRKYMLLSLSAVLCRRKQLFQVKISA